MPSVGSQSSLFEDSPNEENSSLEGAKSAPGFALDVTKTETIMTTVKLLRDKGGKVRYCVNKQVNFQMAGHVDTSPNLFERIRVDAVAQDFIPDLGAVTKKGPKRTNHSENGHRKCGRKIKSMEKVHEETDTTACEVILSEPNPSDTTTNDQQAKEKQYSRNMTIDNLKAELQKLKDCQKSSVFAIEKKYKRELNNLKQQLEVNMKEKGNTITRLQSQLHNYQEKAEQVNAVLNVQLKHFEKRTKSLENALGKCQDELETSEFKRSVVKNDRDRLRDKAHILHSQIEKERNRFENLINKLQTKLEAKKESDTQVQRELNRRMQIQVKQLQSELSKERAAKQANENAKLASEKVNKELKLKLEKLEANQHTAIKHLTGQLQSQITKLEAKLYTERKERQVAHEVIINQMEKRLQEAANQLENTKKQNEESLAKLKKNKARLESLERQFDDLKKESIRDKTMRRRAYRELNEAKIANESLTKEVERLKSKLR